MDPDSYGNRFNTSCIEYFVCWGFGCRKKRFSLPKYYLTTQVPPPPSLKPLLMCINHVRSQACVFQTPPTSMPEGVTHPNYPPLLLLKKRAYGPTAYRRQNHRYHHLIFSSLSLSPLLHRNVQWFRGGLVFKAHRLCVSLNSRLERNKQEEDSPYEIDDENTGRLKR